MTKSRPTGLRRLDLLPGVVARSESGALGKPFVFLADHGVRETIEAVLIAVVLALLFRTFQAENFIIPTGSMAPGLMGQHMDVVCSKCDFAYQTGARMDSWLVPKNERIPVSHTHCPMCGYRMTMNRLRNPDHRSNQGDRIVVDKFLYDFIEPERFEVIVFKNPNNGKQNYIKRLVGRPGDRLTIEHGDLFQVTERAGNGWNKEIIRKPADKLPVLLILVDDTNYIARQLHDAGWPLRWQDWAAAEDSDWTTVLSQGNPVYSVDGSSPATTWIRYRHLVPTSQDWDYMEEHGKPADWVGTANGRLIADYYTYNDSEPYHAVDPNGWLNGLHWVGDLGVQADMQVTGNSGKVLLDAVEGGAHFTCEIDVASGVAALKCSDASVEFIDGEGRVVATPQGKTALTGAGNYDVRFANVDDCLWLWVNGRLVTFDAATYRRPRPFYPQWSPSDPGDAEPLGVGSQGAALSLRRLRVWRDTYYTSARGNSTDPRNEYREPAGAVRRILNDPQSWGTDEAKRVWDRRNREGGPMFVLDEGQYMPMGDNSPESLDSRVWDGPNYVDRELLIGRALYVFWPHPLNRPIPYFPNFGKMRRIR